MPLFIVHGIYSPNGIDDGNRSGSIDPVILIYLEREDQDNPDSLNSLLLKESGLKGISGISGDMRAITMAIAREGWHLSP